MLRHSKCRDRGVFAMLIGLKPFSFDATADSIFVFPSPRHTSHYYSSSAGHVLMTGVFIIMGMILTADFIAATVSRHQPFTTKHITSLSARASRTMARPSPPCHTP